MRACEDELCDLANDGYGIEIAFIPGEYSGSSSILIYRPTGPDVISPEISIFEFTPDAEEGEKVKQVWIYGKDRLDALKKFLEGGGKSE